MKAIVNYARRIALQYSVNVVYGRITGIVEEVISTDCRPPCSSIIYLAVFSFAKLLTKNDDVVLLERGWGSSME